MRSLLLTLVLATPAAAQDFALRATDITLSPTVMATEIFDRDLVYFDDGISRYNTDRTYTWTYSAANGGGIWPGTFTVADTQICVTFESGAERCDMLVRAGDRLTLLTADGDRYPIREVR